ncbi:MAG: hypothetical protein QXV17_12680 [Candidatus Micrarchaeaceae archaeon]
MVSTFSIQQTLTAGQNTVTLPQTGITLKGISCLGIPYMAFNLSTGKTAYVPLGNATGVGGLSFKDPMFRCHYTFDDITFTVVVPNTPSSPAIFYFGDPEDDSIALEDLTGVLGEATLTQGSTAGMMSTSISFSLPEGRIMLTGIYSYVSANFSIVSFPVSTGKVLNLFNSNQIGNQTIHPIAVEGSQSFTINLSGYVNASATNTYYVILYYKVLT